MYVSHCDLCLHTKIQHHLPSGELQPLPIPEEHWDVISVNFISELLESGGYDSIMVAVDSVGKHSHFIEMVTTVTAAGAANLYLQNIWKLHGLLRKVISNRGPQFVAAFMKELYRLLGIEATTSTAYHPQTDGVSSSGRDKMTGTHSSLWQSFPTTTMSTPPCNRHPSSLILAGTHGWASNRINLRPTSKRLTSLRTR